MLSRNLRLGMMLSAAVLAGGGGLLAACASNPASGSAAVVPLSNKPVIVATRRLTESQYRHAIADIFGADILITGRFEPERREGLLLAVGSSQLSISAAGFEQYYAMARSIADQALDEKRRDRFADCKPADAKGPDDACAMAFVEQYGKLIFRRPLTPDEVGPRVALARKAATNSGDYYMGLKLALVSLLTAPEHLFRMEVVERAGRTMRLDGYSRAARLSYLFWDAPPDEALLDAAATGALHTQKGLQAQVERMMASPKLTDGARAFFADMLQLDAFETLTKDPAIYPKYSQAVADSAKEHTLKTVLDHVVDGDGDYREVFTLKSFYLNRTLAAVYQVPFVSKDEWVKHTFADGSERAGLLTQVTFLSLFSHPGKNSPTKRGVALNEVFLCEKTPQPPANVDTSIINDATNPNLRTVRDKLLAHATDEACSGCHNRSDPLGLALERFDSLGQRRSMENGKLIDVKAEFEGKVLDGAEGLGLMLRDHPKAHACLVRNVYAYGVGQAPEDDEARAAYLERQGKAFAAGGYRYKALLKQITLTPEFFHIVPPPPPAAGPDEAEPDDAKVAGRGVTRDGES